ncbi:MAG: DUF427 domain-containing protein [Halanaerobiales bacterium]|nr:DUF427 domain-containing protein [Halanaerobiales bacterium]
MVKIFWQEKEIASSNKTEVIDGDHYFPPESVKIKYFKKSEKHSTDPWKGEANYYNLKDGEQNVNNAAWFYPEPKKEVEKIKEKIAFYSNKVDIIE